MKRRFLAVLAVLVLLTISVIPASLAAGSTYVGTWVCVAVALEGGSVQTEIDGKKVSDIFSMELRADGTAVSDASGEEVTGTWEEVNDGITVTADGETAAFTFENNQLVIREDGMSLYMEKEKQEPKAGGLLSHLLGNKYVGQWVAAAMDEGDGEVFTDIDGVKVSDMLSLTINKDGTMVVISNGEQQTVPWQEMDGGISTNMWGEAVTMLLKDGQLVATGGDGYIVYFDRQASNAVTAAPTPTATPTPTEAPAVTVDLAGEWKAVTYETMGYSFEASALFPDGCTVTFFEDGTAKAAITKDYSESLTWAQKDGKITINGSYMLGDPQYDEKTGRLTMTYGSDVVLVAFEKSGEEIPFATEAPTTEPKADVQKMTTTLFSASFPAKGWVINEGWQSDSPDYCNMEMDYKDANDATLASITLTAASESVKSYRDKIKQLNEYAQKAGKETLEARKIGGIDFLGTAYENWGWNYLEYTARVIESCMTLSMKIEEPQLIGDDLQSILDSISFSLPELSPPNVDPPLPEDGAPYVPTPTTLPLGKKKVTAAWLRADDAIVVDDRFYNQIAVNGNQLYALTGKMLLSYIIDDSGSGAPILRHTDGMKLGDKHEYLSGTKDGTLYVSQGVYNVTVLKEGADAATSDVSGDLVMHPDGEWGINFWANSDPLLVRVKNGVLTTEPWVLANLSDDTSRKGRFKSIVCVSISQSRIYVAGVDATSGDAQRIAVFDLNGKELYSVGSADWTAEDGLSCVTGIVETKSGFIVLDGNSRALMQFGKDGKFLGKVDCDQLLGTSFAWMSCMVPAGDSGVLIAAVQTRQDESADEVLVFHVTGF